MKKFVFASLLLLVGVVAGAQPGFMFGQAEPEGLARPARQFTLNLTPDGAAQMVVYLPQEPTGSCCASTPNRDWPARCLR